MRLVNIFLIIALLSLTGCVKTFSFLGIRSIDKLPPRNLLIEPTVPVIFRDENNITTNRDLIKYILDLELEMVIHGNNYKIYNNYLDKHENKKIK